MPDEQPLLPRILRGRPPLSGDPDERKRRYQSDRRKRLKVKTVSFEVTADLHERVRRAAGSTGQTAKTWVTAVIRAALRSKKSGDKA
ncbi:MAG: hypothetical protein QOH88_1797 [Verrucomicrobiota bacterium]|jgi:alkyl hydroperoxide reductase subunit AhpC